MVKVSVIIPVYKVPLEYLQACFDSLVAQTMQECEFVVVSDGAPDRECSICEEYAAKNSRFKFIKREHAGVSATRNYGIEHALGEYIAFIDSDDMVVKNFCETIYTNAKKWKSDILLFSQISKKKEDSSICSLFNENINRISGIQYKNLVQRLYCPQIVDGPTLIRTCCQAYRASFVKDNALHFNSNLNYSEDQFFNLKAFLKTKHISYFADYPIYIQILRPNSLTFSYKANYELEVYYYLEKIKEIAETAPDLIDIKLFYDRTIQCILYTLDKCLFRPDKRLSLKSRKSAFLSFLNNTYCKEALLKFDRNNFNILERIACFLCRKKAFWILLFVSKKWHIQHRLNI